MYHGSVILAILEMREKLSRSRVHIQVVSGGKITDVEYFFGLFIRERFRAKLRDSILRIALIRP